MALNEFAADSLLARRAAAADPAARHEIVGRLLPRTQRVCRKVLSDPVSAKDAAQTAILEVLCSIHSYRGECSIEHWADRIVSRTALRSIHHERRSRRGEAGDAALVEGEVTEPRVLLRECLQSLPEPQATALLLRGYFEYSIDEIAAITNVSRNSVKDRLVRARQAVRAMVQGKSSASFNGFAEVATPALQI